MARSARRSAVILGVCPRSPRSICVFSPAASPSASSLSRTRRPVRLPRERFRRRPTFVSSARRAAMVCIDQVLYLYRGMFEDHVFFRGTCVLRAGGRSDS
eukprot:Amastigsp_a3057_288.p3 type:complete len:100 gc:universal Amastigsp_a3057_288:390-91(-)